MGRKKSKAAQVGLKFAPIILSDDGRLSSDQELLIVQDIIFNNSNLKQVERDFKIKKELVSEVYLKYYIQIERSLKNSIKENELNKAINDSVSILQKHTNELKKIQNNSQNKYLNSTSLTSVTRSLDRLITLKNASTSEYKEISNISDKINKQKTLEKIEKGEIETSDDYLENQNTVLELLKNNSKKIKITNTDTGEVFKFKSIRAAGNYLQTDPSYIGQRINKKYKNFYIEEDK